MSDLIAEGLLEVCDCRSATIARLKAEAVEIKAGALLNIEYQKSVVTRLEAEIVWLRAVANAAQNLIDNSPFDDDDKPYASDIAQSEFSDLWRALIALAEAQPAMVRYRHKKRGTTYEIVADEVELQVTAGSAIEEGWHLTIYRGGDGKVWARPTREFYDGRFELLHASAQPQE